jgi:hypothetical protein
VIDLYRRHRLFPWINPPWSGHSPFPGCFLKRRLPPVLAWCVSSIHARKPSAKETPASPLSGARWKASSQADRHRPGHATGAQGGPCPDQTQPDGRSSARGRAGGVQRDAAESNAWGMPSASRHGQRERTPAAPSTRRSVEPVGVPAVPGADTARHGRAIQPDGRSPAQGRAGGLCLRSPAWTRAPIRHQEEGRQAARIGITCAPMRSVSR